MAGDLGDNCEVGDPSGCNDPLMCDAMHSQCLCIATRETQVSSLHLCDRLSTAGKFAFVHHYILLGAVLLLLFDAWTLFQKRRKSPHRQGGTTTYWIMAIVVVALSSLAANLLAGIVHDLGLIEPSTYVVILISFTLVLIPSYVAFQFAVPFSWMEIAADCTNLNKTTFRRTAKLTVLALLSVFVTTCLMMLPFSRTIINRHILVSFVGLFLPFSSFLVFTFASRKISSLIALHREMSEAVRQMEQNINMFARRLQWGNFCFFLLSAFRQGGYVAGSRAIYAVYYRHFNLYVVLFHFFAYLGYVQTLEVFNDNSGSDAESPEIDCCGDESSADD